MTTRTQTGTGPTPSPAWLKVAPVVFLLLWSAGLPVAKIGLVYADPMTLLLLRYGFVLIVLVPVFLVVRPPLPGRAADWGHLIVIGLLIQALYFGLSWYSFSLGVSTGVAALIIALQPVMVAVIAPHAIGEDVSRHRFLGLLLGLAGAVIVILAQSEIETSHPLAIVGVAGAMFSMVAATLYEKRFGVSHHPVTSNLLQYVVGFVAVLPLALATEPLEVEWSGELMAALAYLVLCNSLLAVSLLLAMIRHGEASRVSALFFLVPPCVALMAWVLLDERLVPLSWVGMAVAAVGVAMVGRPAPRVRRS